MRYGPARTPAHALLWSILLDADEDDWVECAPLAEVLGWAPHRVGQHMKTWQRHRWVEVRKDLNERDRWGLVARLTPQGRVFARVWYSYGDLLVQMHRY